MNCNQCLGVHADFNINIDPTKGGAYSLNGELFGKGRETYPLARIFEILGDPAGAYCTVETERDANGNDVTRPGRVVYFWKSGNFEEGNLVLAYGISYSWGDDITAGREVDISHLAVILTDHTDKITNLMSDFYLTTLLPGMQELGLY